MRFEDIVVSMDLSKSLKKVGYPQVGLFYWYDTSSVGGAEYKLVQDRRGYQPELLFAAPTTVELATQLPQNIEDEEYDYLTWHTYPSINGWHLDYSTLQGLPVYEQRANTEADVRAKMWLYLKKNGLLQEQLTSK